MRRTTFVALSLVALLALPRATHAQETAAAFAERYFSALRTSDWDAAAQLMHPDALLSLKSMFAPVVAADSSGEVLQLLGMRTRADFDKAKPAAMFASLMRSVTSLSPGVGDMMAGARTVVIGTVPEAGTSLQHVVYRMTMGMQGMQVEKLSVITLQPHGSSWGVTLTAEVRGMAEALNRSIRPR